MKKKSDGQFSKRESKERFEAALRGARIGAKPMNKMPKKFKNAMPEKDDPKEKRNIQK